MARDSSPVFPVALVALITSIAFIFRPRSTGGVIPSNLPDPIPYVFNTVQFVFNNEKFMKRVTYEYSLMASLSSH